MKTRKLMFAIRVLPKIEQQCPSPCGNLATEADFLAYVDASEEAGGPDCWEHFFRSVDEIEGDFWEFVDRGPYCQDLPRTDGR